MDDEKVVELKEVKKENENEIKFTNFLLEMFMNSTQIQKLVEAEDLSSACKFKIHKLVSHITGSSEAKAYELTKNSIIKKWEADQEKLPEEERKPLRMDDPLIKDLVETKLDLRIDRLVLKVTELPNCLSVSDMNALDWIIRFEEDVSSQ